MKDSLTPILKWPGGKQGELKLILPNIPQFRGRYFEPFLGGGAVYLAIQPAQPYVNDLSFDLINLYTNIAAQDEQFFIKLNDIDQDWKKIREFVESQRVQILDIYQDFRTSHTSANGLKAQLGPLLSNVAPPVVTYVSFQNGYEPARHSKTIQKVVVAKLRRMKKLENKKGLMPHKDVLDNFEGAVKAAFYTHARYLYNNWRELDMPEAHRAAFFFFIRETAYGSMFRYNQKGLFNIPYGGISYNSKDFGKKLEKMQGQQLQALFASTVFENLDFHDFLVKHSLTSDDFVFLDPPYDTEFSSYDQNHFTQQDHLRLAKFLTGTCSAKFMLVIQANEFITSLYEQHNLNIQFFDKTYMYTVKERNDREATHLIITNYET